MTDGAGDRLTRMIARLETQRACLAWAIDAVADLDGPVLEIGLGKGRTYDYLRHHACERDIQVFDRDVHCPDDVRPPVDRLTLGDFRDTLAAAADRLPPAAALAHADIGSDRSTFATPRGTAIAVQVGALMRPGGLVGRVEPRLAGPCIGSRASAARGRMRARGWATQTRGLSRASARA